MFTSFMAVQSNPSTGIDVTWFPVRYHGLTRTLLPAMVCVSLQGPIKADLYLTPDDARTLADTLPSVLSALDAAGREVA